MRHSPSPRILIVDESPELAEHLDEPVRQLGYELTAARTLKEANGASEGIDVALINVRLPDGEGAELARHLKAKSPDCEVVLLTGYSTLEAAVAAVRAGAWAYLMKPVALPELLATINQALQQVRQTRETRQLARRALVAEKLAAFGTLTSGLSHELRNPLNSAALQLALLERQVRRLPDELQPALVEPLRLAQAEVSRLNGVLEDFLQFARPTELALRLLDLCAIAQRVQLQLGPEAERRGLRLAVEGDPSCPLEGDEERLQQLLVSLVRNGLEATPPGGSVTIGCYNEPGSVRLVVQDTGVGLGATVLRRLFEPFFTTKDTASGLGLPISHAIVTQHGGTITAEPLSTGGARFTVHLPGP